MAHKHKQPPVPDSDARPLGNESPDPFSPTLPPGTLHELLRSEEEEVGGDSSQAMDNPDADSGDEEE